MGRRLRNRARELGVTDTEVARRADISQPRYANYVNDANEPDLGTLVRICRALDTSPDQVLGFAESPEASPGEVFRSRIAAAAQSMDPQRLRLAATVVEAMASLPQES